MKRAIRLLGAVLGLLLTSCQPNSSAEEAAVRPATPAEAAVSVMQQLETLSPELGPLIERRYRGQTFIRFLVDKPAPPGPAAADTLRQLVRREPDAGNITAEAVLNLVQEPVLGREPAPEIERLLQHHPESDLAWYLLAGLQSQRRDYAAALTSISEAIRHNDQTGAYYRERADIYFMAEDNPAAIRDYLRALELYRAKRKLYEQLAMVSAGEQYLRAQDWLIADSRRALAQLQRRPAAAPLVKDSLLMLREDIGYNHLAKAMYLIDQGRVREACPDLQQARALRIAEADTMLHHCR